MRGDENRLIDADVAWLERGNWTVGREVNFVNVYAERGDERLYAEAKGRTTSPGLDVDTLYGQLLRRMKDPKPGDRYAVVVPTSAPNAASRAARSSTNAPARLCGQPSDLAASHARHTLWGAGDVVRHQGEMIGP